DSRINNDRARLMKGPDQILAELVVDRGLSSDRAVNLREQRRGNLNVVDPAQKSRGDKPRKVAHHAAAERDHTVRAFKTIGDQKTPGAFGRAQRLRPLAVADQMRERSETGLLQASFNGLAVKRVNLRVRDDCEAPSFIAQRGAGDFAGSRQGAVGDGDVVTAFGERNVNCLYHEDAC